MNHLSVVINTFNEEKNIERAIKSVLWADEIIVCDMYSKDATVQIARKLGAKIYYHKLTNYVEPARNFAISKASNEWILVLDADEQIPQTLAEEIKKIKEKQITPNYVEIPRKNIIFGRWMKESMWWPDYNIRLFKKGKVVWDGKIHAKPRCSGEGIKLDAEEELAIIHYNYQSVSQFILRMNRYTDIEAEFLFENGVKFDWTDLIRKPLSEFLNRFFANKGYLDGLHGFSLSLLQSLSFLIVYLKVWEKYGFKDKELDLGMLEKEKNNAGYQVKYWFLQSRLSKNSIKRFFQKLRQI